MIKNSELHKATALEGEPQIRWRHWCRWWQAGDGVWACPAPAGDGPGNAMARRTDTQKAQRRRQRGKGWGVHRGTTTTLAFEWYGEQLFSSSGACVCCAGFVMTRAVRFLQSILWYIILDWMDHGQDWDAC